MKELTVTQALDLYYQLTNREISQQRLNKLILQRRIKAERFGSRWAINRRSFEKFIAEPRKYGKASKYYGKSN